MGGDFQSKGQQDCTKGIYALAGEFVWNWGRTWLRNKSSYTNDDFDLTVILQSIQPLRFPYFLFLVS